MGRRALEIKVELKGDCLVVVSHKPNQDGYIRIWNGKKCEMYHRRIWELNNGPIPDGYEVDHKCRQRDCCNILHLQILTTSDHKTKTNLERYADRISEIRKCIEVDEKVKDIAIKFNVSAHCVRWHKRKIKNGIEC